MCVRLMICLCMLFSILKQHTAVASKKSSCDAPCRELYPGPNGTVDIVQWQLELKEWREKTLQEIDYKGGVYGKYLSWTEEAVVETQLMVHDRYFYDRASGRYTVDRFLDYLTERYGGVDCVLVWGTYPNIGVDDRNQFDMVRDFPSGFQEAVRAFQSRGVHVLLPYNPWDTATARPRLDDVNELSQLILECGAEGFNGDTMLEIPESFWNRSVELGHPIALEPEEGGSAASLAWTKLGWGYWGWNNTQYSWVPGVARLRYLEPRHQTFVCDRFSQNKSSQIQFALFNGAGLEAWQNVWGFYNGLTDRDAEAIRRASALLRYFRPYFFTHPDSEWTPFATQVKSDSHAIFASSWNLAGISQLWVIINRGSQPVCDVLILPENIGFLRGNTTPTRRCFNVYAGFEYMGDPPYAVEIEGEGFSCVVCWNEGVGDNSMENFHQFLELMREMTKRPLSEYSPEFKVLLQRMISEQAGNVHRVPFNETRVNLPATDNFLFEVHGIEVEGGNMTGMDVQFPWESVPTRYHRHYVNISSLKMDRYPVTNAQYYHFLLESNYWPNDDRNFLRHWRGQDIYPEGYEHKPVVWLSIEDARAYASFYGARLPNDWEYNWAASGGQWPRAFPWGDAWDEGRHVPASQGFGTMRAPDDVGVHPDGMSPFGVEDLVGLVWQMSNSFEDEHTSSLLLRGGCFYRPNTSKWYFPDGFRIDEHGKLLLMAPSLDRSAAIGFRTIVEV